MWKCKELFSNVKCLQTALDFSFCNNTDSIKEDRASFFLSECGPQANCFRITGEFVNSQYRSQTDCSVSL